MAGGMSIMEIGILNGFIPDRISLQKVTWYRMVFFS